MVAKLTRLTQQLWYNCT